jgi:hypothetical protein
MIKFTIDIPETIEDLATLGYYIKIVPMEIWPQPKVLAENQFSEMVSVGYQFEYRTYQYVYRVYKDENVFVYLKSFGISRVASFNSKEEAMNSIIEHIIVERLKE